MYGWVQSEDNFKWRKDNRLYWERDKANTFATAVSSGKRRTGFKKVQFAYYEHLLIVIKFGHETSM